MYGYIWPIYLHIWHIFTQMVHKMTSQCIYSQKADAHYTKLTKVQCNNTKLPRKGLKHQPSYLATW